MICESEFIEFLCYFVPTMIVVIVIIITYLMLWNEKIDKQEWECEK
jgi:hypothetical protein